MPTPRAAAAVTSEQIQHARRTRAWSRGSKIVAVFAVTLVTLAVCVVAPVRYFDDNNNLAAELASKSEYTSTLADRVECDDKWSSSSGSFDAERIVEAVLLSDEATYDRGNAATTTTTTTWTGRARVTVDRVVQTLGDVVLGLFGFDEQDWFDFSSEGLTQDEEFEWREMGLEGSGNGNGLASWSESSLYVERTQSLHPSRPSAFGPHLLEKPLRGFLYPISIYTSSPYGCSAPVASSPVQHGEWIALIQRGECPFSNKVRVAQQLGAKAVVFGDEDEERGGIKGGKGLLTPWSPDDTKDITIPSIFVSRASYLSLIKTWQDEQRIVLGEGKRASRSAQSHVGLEVVLSKDEMFTWPLLDLLFLLLFLPSLLTLLTVFTQRVRIARAQKAERAPKSAVAKLVVFKWGDPSPEKPIATPASGGGAVVRDEEREIGLGASPNELGEERRDVEDEEDAVTESTALLQPTGVTTARTRPVTVSSSLVGRLRALVARRFRFGPRASSATTTTTSLNASTLPVRGANPRYPSLTECSICLDPFVVNESIVIELPCSHLFHRDCAMDWLLQRKGVCPICRKSVMDDDDSLPRPVEVDVAGTSTSASAGPSALEE